MSKRDLFLAELKSHYDKEFELKNTLESKANYILAAAGIVVTLLFSFGSPIIEKLAQHSEVFLTARVLLITGISANVLAILCSVLAFRITLYKYAMPSDAFYDDKGNLNDEVIAEYSDGNDLDVFGDTMIETYLDCNRHNDAMNNEKTIKIKIAQWSFFTGIVIIPLIIVLIMK